MLLSAAAALALMNPSAVITGEMLLDNGASGTTTSSITIDSGVASAVSMRVGPPATQVGVGWGHVVSIDSSGALWAWGWNNYGQFGDGSTVSTTAAVPVGTATDWATAVAGDNCSFFLKNDGTLYASGYNYYGQLGIGSKVSTATQVMVGGSGEWESVSAGAYHTLGIKKDGSLWAWGRNASYQLGDGTGIERLVPKRIGTDNDWKLISAGPETSYAIKDSGALLSWGINNVGQTGTGSQTSIPTTVAAGSTWKAVSGGNYSAAGIKTDGSLYTWGSGTDGQMGDGTTFSRFTPGFVSAGPFDAVSTDVQSLALKSDGTVWSWGNNSYGQVGDGTTGNGTALPRPSMRQVMTGATSIATGPNMSAAFSGGSLWTWGRSMNGVLGGSQSGSDQLRPLRVNTDWMPFAAHYPWQLAESDGTHKVGVEYRDAVDGAKAMSDTIDYDSTPPAGTTVVNDGVALTKNLVVGIRSSVTNVVDMRIGEGAWVPYASASSTTLPSGDGTKTVVMTYRDQFARTLTTTSTLALDTVAPSGTFNVNAGNATTRFRTALAQSAVSADAVAMRVEPPVGWNQIAMNGSNTYGIRSDKTLWVAGWNWQSLTGDGLPATSYFRQVGDGATWQSVSIGNESSNPSVLAIKNDGSLWGWGENSYYQLSDGTTLKRQVPSRIGSASDWKLIAGTGTTGAGVKTNGTLWTWGQNGAGQCGLGTTTTPNWTTPQTSQQQVMAGSTWKALSAGLGSYAAIRTDGTLWMWGLNSGGQLGNGTTTNSSKPVTPTIAANYSDWATCTAGDYTTYAIRSNGDLWAWGTNWAGMVGSGTTTDQLAPVFIGGGYKSVAAGSYHALAVKTNGELWSWGWGANGQLGEGTVTQQNSPVRVGNRSDWVSVEGGTYTSSGVTADGRLWAWGQNSGVYGDGFTTNRPFPVSSDWFAYSTAFPFRLAAGNGSKTVNVIVRDLAGNEGTLTDTISLDASASAGSVVANTGAAWSASPTITLDANVPNAIEMCEGAPVTSVAAANYASGFVRSDGLLMMSGYNGSSRLGGGGTVSQTSPIISTALRNWAWVGIGGAHTLALTTDGTLYGWGSNSSGQLGTGDTSDRATPYLIGVPGEWARASAGPYHSVAVKKDGSMWAWGNASDSLIGDGTTSGTQLTPKKITATSDWKYVSAGVQHNLAVRNNGELWAWGDNAKGQLGYGSGTAVLTTPTKIGTATDWASVSAGTDHSLGLKVDGALWAWGDRYRGQVGEGSTVNNSPQWTPLKIEGNGFTAVSAGQYLSLALRADGSMWGWGANNAGELTPPSTWGVASPKRIGTTSDWAAVAAGNGFCVAAKTDGTAWTWGGNSYGERGDAGTTNDGTYPGEIMKRTWVPYVSTKTVQVQNPVGIVPVTAGFRDVAGNVTWLSDDIGFDFSAPVTTITGGPVSWATAPLNVRIALAQPEESGLAGIKYRINGGAVTDYTLLTDIPVSAEGTTTFGLSGTDVLGHVEVEHDVTVSVDTVKPITTMSVTPGAGNTSIVTLAPTDSTSGPGYTYYAIDGGTVTTYTATFATAPGAQDIRFWSVDVAGNVEAATSTRLQGASAIITGAMQLNGGASNTTTSSIAIDSAVVNAVGMRVGPPAVKVAIGWNHVISIDSSGALWAWGRNTEGQFGKPWASNTAIAVPISMERDWAAVAASQNRSFFLKNDGTLYAAGSNANGELGIGSTTSTGTKVMVGVVGEWKSVSAGDSHTLAIKKDGSLWAWGSNSSYQLGDNTTVNSWVPKRIGSATDWKLVSAGSTTSYAIKDAGTLWSWGANNTGQGGTGSQNRTPAQVAVGSTWKAIAGGQVSAAAIKTDGSLYTWGSGTEGQMGDGTTSGRSTPGLANAGPFVDVASSGHTLALKSDGTVMAWGGNSYGQVGDGTTTGYGLGRPTMTRVMTGATSIAVGNYMSAAFGGGSMTTWGTSFSGILGGSYYNQLRPLAVNTDWMPYTSQYPWRLSENDGTHTVNVEYRDAAENTRAMSDTICYDATPPSGTTIVNDGVAMTKELDVGINSAITNVVDMRIGEGPWVPYVAASRVTLSSGDGTKTVAVTYRDEFSRSLTHTATLVLDTTAPSGTFSINAGDATTRFRTAVAQSSVSADAVAMRVEPPVGWDQISMGGSATFGIRSDKTLWVAGWGYPVLTGDGSPATSSFRQVGDGATWQSVTVGSDSGNSTVLAIKEDGSLWGWGGNTTYQLSDGTTLSKQFPSRVGSSSDWKLIAETGATSAGIKTNGTLWTWGENGYGQCGLGTTTTPNWTTPQPTQQQVMVGSTWKALSVGRASFVGIMADGTLWTWGRNADGQLGDGTTTNSSKPLRPAGTALYSDWTTCAAGDYTTYAVRSNGDLWAWGSNWAGSVGNGTTTQQSAPVLIGSGFKSVAAGSYHALGVKTNGQLWTWGNNGNGQVGDGSTTQRNSPVRVGTRSDWTSSKGGGYTSTGQTADGRLWAWGQNSGMFADSFTTNRPFPVSGDWFAYSTKLPFRLGAGNGSKTVNMIVRDLAGNEATLTDTISLDASASAGSALVNGGAAWSSSATVTLDANVPNAVEMCEGAPVVSVAAANYASGFVRSDGLLMMSGSNAYSRLGGGGGVSQTSPIMSTSVRNWAWVGVGGFHTLALTADGTLYGWGGNSFGQLGAGDTVNRTTPYLIGVPGEWARASAGSYHSVAIKKDGSMWAWGNAGGSLIGDGTTSGAQLTPKKITATSDWKYISAGVQHNLAVRNNGELYAWGDNAKGQLGYGSGTAVLTTPTKIGTATDWASVSAGTDHSLGLKVDGALWAWGDRYRGQVGDGTYVNNSPQWTPLKIEGSGFTAVSAGQYLSLAVRADGSMWGWGANNAKELTPPNSWAVVRPKRIGSTSDWAAVAAGNGFCVAAKTDGTAWTWGGNTYGELGDAGTGNDGTYPGEIMKRTWAPYVSSKSIKVPYPIGDVPVTAGFRDVAGNITWLSDSIKFDITAPVTAISGVPAGWSTSPVNIRFSLTQPEESGLAGIKYRINGGVPIDYTLLTDVLISAEGTTTIGWWGVDMLGTAEVEHTATVSVDSVKPVTISTTVPEWVSTSTVTLTPTDPTSGVSRTRYSVDDGTVATYTAPISAPEGIHEIRYWSVDVAGNIENTITATSKVDLHAPVSSSSGLPTGWSATNAVVSLSATDALSGVGGLRYAIDGGSAIEYSAPVVIGNGVHVLTWRAIDNVGNAETTQSATVTIDTAIPSTTSDCDGLWHATPVVVSLAATDPLSGVATTTYRLNDGAETPYVAPLLISAEGTNTVAFWSVDVMGNVEPTHVVDAKIDYTHPDTTIAGVPAGESDTAVSLSLTAADGGSGVGATYYRLNGGQRRPYVAGQTAIVIATEGATSVEYWSVDTVGNSEPPATAEVNVRYPSAISPTTRNPTCVGCHSSSTGPTRVRLNFAVGDVDRATACPKCHDGSLAGTHPRHNAAANCGAICHAAKLNSPAWGDSLVSNIPTFLDSYGAFASASSQNTPSNLLHIIHSKPRWEQTIDTADSKCGSCHAAASCDACHEAPLDASHYAHASTMTSTTPWAGDTASGVIAGDQSIDSHVSGDSVRCGSAACHNSVGVRNSAPGLLDDSSHPASAQYGYLANVVTKTPSASTTYWKTQTANVYTLGQMTRSNYLNATLSVPFTGEQIVLVADKDPYRGIAEIKIDGVSQGTVDLYADTTRNQVEVFKSAVLAAGPHTILVRVTGTKNLSARAAYITVDQFKVYSLTPGPVAPLCSQCHPDRVAEHGYGEADHVADSGNDIEPLSGAKCTACHSMDLLTEHERVGSSSKGGSCITCHEAPRKSFSAWNQSCQQGGCHTPQTTQERHAGLPTAHDVITQATCTQNCHESAVPSEHTKSAVGRAPVTCVECHNSTQYAASVRTVVWDKTCVACHAASHAPAVADNTSCFECHGASSAVIDALGGAGTHAATAGDHEPGYASSAHGSAVPAGADGGKPSAIQCEACHNHNAIGNGAVTQFRVNGKSADQSALCFECHSASGEETRTAKPNSWNGRDIATEFGRTSHHPVVGSEAAVGDQSSLACVSCHGAHVVQKGSGLAWDTSRVSDPINGKSLFANASDSSVTAFCLKCHADVGIARSLSVTTALPYSVVFRDLTPGGALFPGWDKTPAATAFESAGHFTTTGTKALCENCHDPHGSNNANLTAWTKPAGFVTGSPGSRDNTSQAGFEENLCLQCHGNGVVGNQAPGAQDIATSLSAAYRHDQSPARAHSDTETVSDLSTNRHAECVDCHDPHSAKPGVHAAGSTLGQVLIGATAVRPQWSGTPGASATQLTPMRITGAASDSEALVCFKCHATQRPVTRPDSSTYTSTDLTKEFNPSNLSYHNVFGLSVGMRSSFNIGGTAFSWTRPAESSFLKAGWHYDSTVTCSDCHTSGSMSAAKGPHGSSAPFLMDPEYPTKWSTAHLDKNTASGIRDSAPIICSKCHDLRNSNNVHNAYWFSSAYQPHGSGECNGCHVAIPHGWKRPRLIVYNSDPAPYNQIPPGYSRVNGIEAVTMRSHAADGWYVSDCQAGCTTWLGHDTVKANTMP